MRKSVAILWLCLLGAAPRGEEMRGMRHPALSPDGRRIAFDWHGDLWIVPVAGGPAERLTQDPAHEEKACWSPDGTRLAFTSDKTGNLDLFVIELATRSVRQLTVHSQDDDAPAWSPDGQWIAFQSNRDSNLDLALNNSIWDLWKIPAAGGTAARITRFRGENPAWSPDGRRIAYNRYASGYGDGEHNIFLISADGAGIPRVIAAGTEDSRRPVFHGSTLYFAHEANGIQASSHRNIWRTTVNGGALIQVTGHRNDHVTWPTISQKGDVMVYEHDFDLYSIDLRQPLPKPRKLTILTEHRYDDPATPRTYTSGFRSPSWSPSGSTIAFSCRGDLWTVSAEGGAAKNLTQGVADDREPSWSSDEKRLVFVSGPSGMAGYVCVIDAKGGEPRRITLEEGTYKNPRLSSDGSRVVFTRQDEEDETDVWIATVDGGESRAVAAEKDVDESFGCFSPDGKSIAYLSTQSGRTDVAIVPVEGGETRIYRTDASTKSGLAWSPDGSKVAYTARPPDGSSSLRTLTIATSEEKIVATGGRYPAWSPDGSMLVTEIEPRGGSPADAQTLVIYDTRSSQKMPLAVKATRSVTRREDMLGVYLQVWGSYAGYYYDPFFHGVDMAALREKYRVFAEECQTRAELHSLINEMLGELRSSHIRLQPVRVKNDVATGAIGADLVRSDDGLLRAWNIEANGPAAKAGIQDGEVIVGVGTSELKPETDLDRFFTVPGEAVLPEVSLSIRDSRGELRTATVKPIDRMALRELKYENRIAWRKKVVRERSQGRLVYHHLKMMVQAEVTRLKKALEEECAEAEGLVLDERDGVGGLAHRPLCALLDSTSPQRLNASPACWTRNRSGVTTPDKYGSTRQGEKCWDKPVILIQNEISRSDKEIFPYTFRHLGIGYLVGMPTAGGVIGGSDWTMQDGSRITVSVQGWFTADGRNMEGWGVPPDFRVAETHEDLLAGRDAQLEKAIEVLLAQMDGKIAAPRKVGEKKSEVQPGK